jgi:hypothetical protein
MMLRTSTAASTAVSKRHSAAAPRPRVAARSHSGDPNGNGAALADGTKVKVVKPIKVYHVPKLGAELDLEGLEGVVQRDVTQFKGVVLSANLPYLVKFSQPAADGKAVNFTAHLVRMAGPPAHGAIAACPASTRIGTAAGCTCMMPALVGVHGVC